MRSSKDGEITTFGVDLGDRHRQRGRLVLSFELMLHSKRTSHQVQHTDYTRSEKKKSKTQGEQHSLRHAKHCPARKGIASSLKAKRQSFPSKLNTECSEVFKTASSFHGVTGEADCLCVDGDGERVPWKVAVDRKGTEDLHT
eukprot:4376617-Pleurochrysis_carterae.AAC.1